MPLSVALVVLCGALLHAVWNAIVQDWLGPSPRHEPDRGRRSLLSAAALPFLTPPAAASWPYLGASVLTQIVYFWLVAAAHGTGDLSRVYPLMRGATPLPVAIASAPLLDETPPSGRWLGVALFSAGICFLAAEHSGPGHWHWRSRALALLTACVIATYTFISRGSPGMTAARLRLSPSRAPDPKREIRTAETIRR